MGFVFFPQFAWSGILVLKETAFWLNTKESLKNNWPLLDIILSISRVSDNNLTIVSPEKSANKASNGKSSAEKGYKSFFFVFFTKFLIVHNLEYFDCCDWPYKSTNCLQLFWMFQLGNGQC